MALQFYIIILSKNIQPPFKCLFSLFFRFVNNGLWYFSTDATGSGNQSFMVLEEEFFVNPRPFAIHPFGVAIRAEFAKVFVALMIFGKQQLVVTVVFISLSEFFPG